MSKKNFAISELIEWIEFFSIVLGFGFKDNIGFVQLYYWNISQKNIIVTNRKHSWRFFPDTLFRTTCIISEPKDNQLEEK